MRLLALILTLLGAGPHAVGARFEGAYVTWYPAQGGGEILRFRDYVPKLEDVDMLLHSMKVSDETIVDLFDTRMAARRDAAPKPPTFPAIVIEGRTAAECAVIAELLASHGFTVTTNPNRKEARRIRVSDELTTWSLVTNKTPRASAQRAAERLLQSLKQRR